MPRKSNVFKLLECFQCGQQFGKKLFNLKRHMKLHVSMKRLKCIICKKTYQNKFNYQTHWFSKHDGEMRQPDLVDCGFPEPNWKKNLRRENMESKVYTLFNIGEYFM